jgi:hypothetical protein
MNGRIAVKVLKLLLLGLALLCPAFATAQSISGTLATKVIGCRSLIADASVHTEK